MVLGARQLHELSYRTMCKIRSAKIVLTDDSIDFSAMTDSMLNVAAGPMIKEQEIWVILN